MSKFEYDKRWELAKDKFGKGFPEIVDFYEHLTDTTLPAFFGAQNSREIMSDALRKYCDGSGPLAKIEVFDIEDMTVNEARRIPLSNYLLALYAYAFFGIINREIGTSIGELGDIRNSDLGIASNMVGRFRSWYLSMEGIQPDASYKFSWGYAICAATARLQLDFHASKINPEEYYPHPPEDTIIPDELAALAEIKVRSIQNLMSPDGPLQTNKKGGGIPVEKARLWLVDRKKFLRSLLDFSEPEEVTYESRPLSDFVAMIKFVPVDADGEWFSTEHQIDGKYIGGEGDNQFNTDDYTEALNRLAAMETPIWQKPLENGASIKIVGVDWTRKTDDELGLT